MKSPGDVNWVLGEDRRDRTPQVGTRDLGEAVGVRLKPPDVRESIVGRILSVRCLNLTINLSSLDYPSHDLSGV